MSLIAIQDPRTLEETESAISKICANPGVPLQLPRDSFGVRRGAMHDAARLQMLVTWARHAGDSCLHFHKENEVAKVLEELCGYSVGLAAIRLSKGITVGDTKVTRREALVPAIERMHATDNGEFPEIINGRSIDMICVSGSSVQYLRPLFYAEKAVKDKFGMQELMRKLTYEINKQDKHLVPESLIKACGIFTNELFKNTQQHATSDYQGKPYTAHVEGMFVSWIQIDERLYASDFQGHDRLKAFWDRELSTSGEQIIKTTLRCLQISFFDSGPGFASRAKGQQTLNIDLDEERQALIDCLKKNVTTKDEAGAGQGLPNVLAELRNIGGLIRIRSGRQSIFNAFAPDANSVDLFDFQDWGAESLGCAEGAVISILIPLRRGQ